MSKQIMELINKKKLIEGRLTAAAKALYEMQNDPNDKDGIYINRCGGSHRVIFKSLGLNNKIIDLCIEAIEVMGEDLQQIRRKVEAIETLIND